MTIIALERVLLIWTVLGRGGKFEKDLHDTISLAVQADSNHMRVSVSPERGFSGIPSSNAPLTKAIVDEWHALACISVAALT